MRGLVPSIHAPRWIHLTNAAVARAMRALVEGGWHLRDVQLDRSGYVPIRRPRESGDPGGLRLELQGFQRGWSWIPAFAGMTVAR
jgi:hypothetical protein